MDTPNFNHLGFEDILSDSNFAKFGDSLVNFIYNASILESTNQLQGVKVWDQCLAEACRNSPLRIFAGSRKSAGELGDAVEAFLGYLYVKNKLVLSDMIAVLTRYISQNTYLLKKDEKKLCSEAFSHLLNNLCEKNNIST